MGIALLRWMDGGTSNLPRGESENFALTPDAGMTLLPVRKSINTSSAASSPSSERRGDPQEMWAHAERMHELSSGVYPRGFREGRVEGTGGRPQGSGAPGRPLLRLPLPRMRHRGRIPRRVSPQWRDGRGFSVQERFAGGRGKAYAGRCDRGRGRGEGPGHVIHRWEKWRIANAESEARGAKPIEPVP